MLSMGALWAIYALFSSSVALALPIIRERQNAPNQSVFLDRLALNVVGADGPFRTDFEFFNPTNGTPPFFQIFDDAFLDILGPNPSVRLIGSNESFAFAHEAPIWIPETGEVFFCSDEGGTRPIHSDIDHNNVVSKINLQEVRAGGNVTITPIPLDESIQITNGATNYKGQILLVSDGRGSLPPNVVLVNPRPPYNSTVLLDNFFGRQFNSLNDVKIHPVSKKIFFTDKTTRFLNHFGPPPDFPNMVYRFDPDTGSVRVVADGFIRSNGIAFSDDGNFAYIADSALSAGFLGNNSTLPATIYQFNVDPDTQSFTNRRVFAYVDKGIPDGIQLDSKGNVYAGCGDGVNIWNPSGDLLGKIYLGDSSANMIFADPGSLVVLSDSNLFYVEFAAQGQDLHGRGL